MLAKRVAGLATGISRPIRYDKAVACYTNHLRMFSSRVPPPLAASAGKAAASKPIPFTPPEKKGGGGGAVLPLLLLGVGVGAGVYGYNNYYDEIVAAMPEQVRSQIEALKPGKPKVPELVQVPAPPPVAQEPVPQQVQKKTAPSPPSPEKVVVVASEPQAGKTSPAPKSQPVVVVEEKPIPVAPAKSEKVQIVKDSTAAPAQTKAPMLKAEDEESPPQQTAQQVAAKQLRAEALARASDTVNEAGVLLKKELEAGILGDLDKLDEQGLRFRIVQLAAEMQERTKWEGVRLAQSLRAAEEEASRRYGSLLAQQKDEAEAALKKQLAAQEQQVREHVYKEFSAKLDEITKQQNAAFENILSTNLANAEAKAEAKAQELVAHEREISTSTFKQQLEAAAAQAATMVAAAAEERSQVIANLRTEVEALDEAWRSCVGMERASITTHAITAAVLALSDRLSTCEPASAELKALRAIGAKDPVIDAATKNVPILALGGGVPTPPQLVQRWPKVHEECRKAALVPEGAGAGVAGRAAGTVLAAVMLQPKGPVPGNDPEAILARAAFHLESGNLKEAVSEVEELRGLSAQVAKDWLSDARARLAADQCVSALKSHTALLNLAIVEALDT